MRNCSWIINLNLHSVVRRPFAPDYYTVEFGGFRSFLELISYLVGNKNPKRGRIFPFYFDFPGLTMKPYHTNQVL